MLESDNPFRQQYPSVHGSTFKATDGVILINFWMGIVRVEDKYWACGCIHTYVHRFIYALYPRLYEYFYVLILRKNHMLVFIKIISKRGEGSAVNLRAEHILSKIFLDINWLTQI